MQSYRNQNMKDCSHKLLLTASGLFCALWTSGLSADWFQYRGPQVDGISHENIQCVFPAAGPKCLWRTPTPAGFSSFAVQGGKAFTQVTRTLEGAASEVCLALDANSGKELWVALVGPAKYQGGGDSGAEGNSGGDGPRSTPAAGGNRVYTYSPDMVLQCLDANSGKPLWSKDAVNLSWNS